MAVKTLLVVAGVIRKRDRLLIAQRNDECPREPGKWEFPGGKVEQGESPQEALKREIMEELGVKIEVGEPFCVSSVISKGKHIILIAFLAKWKKGEPRAIGCKDFRWVRLPELRGLGWARADKPIVEKLWKEPIL